MQGPTHEFEQLASFAIIGQFVVAPGWKGNPLTLQPNDSANMPQTPNGSMIFAYQNLSPQNNQGKLSVSSGATRPTFLTAPALANQPSILVKNWQANNLSITNISPPGTETPIRIEGIGPGLPGCKPGDLPNDGSTISLEANQCAQGAASPRWMQLVLQSNTSQLAVFGLIGGPPDSSGSNAYVFAVNFSQNSGPDTNNAVSLPGYYATTTSNYYTFEFNWGASTLFVANLSPETSSPGKVTLRPL